MEETNKPDKLLSPEAGIPKQKSQFAKQSPYLVTSNYLLKRIYSLSRVEQRQKRGLSV